ncbi:glycoside hydrolase family 105 protein [Bacteroides sp. AN502(2024)]|uniref:glycoside hydrolase family 88/105 protein n=1 Tax=Bacteroides sp. AN502(2024) TaxID=3160599 RepID=UPI0035191A61
MYKWLIILLTTIGLPLTASVGRGFDKWPKGASPREVGSQVSKRFVEVPHPNFNGNPAPPGEITYPETCAWLGALRYAGVTADTLLLRQLEERFLPIFGPERRLQPLPDHVDHTVFGTIPLQLYAQTHKEIYRWMGLWYADEQWTMPHNTRHRNEYQALLDQGLSWQTRFWIDDMFMISAIQSQAYLITHDRKYIDRAATEMVVYLDKIQRPNGLFHHAEDVPFFWGRGNGWMAAGMTELLSLLPVDNPNRPRILDSYRLMMSTLLQYQKADGLWGQLIDDPTTWTETSGSAMFTYAMIKGVKQGWLDAKTYTPVVRKAWIALVKHIDANGDLDGVCEGTNKTNDRQFYLNRKTLLGNMHGQAPVLWCVTAFLEP